MIQIISAPLSRSELKKSAEAMYGNFVKVVVDLRLKIIAVDGELHADEEALLLAQGSKQKDLWGINLYPDKEGKDFIEFDSMINLRPLQGNMSRGIDDPKIQNEIKKIVKILIV